MHRACMYEEELPGEALRQMLLARNTNGRKSPADVGRWSFGKLSRAMVQDGGQYFIEAPEKGKGRSSGGFAPMRGQRR